MENASKALIIAGAILLAIVIISLGLIVVNNVRNTVDTSNLNEQEIQAFNSKFTAYEGQKVSGSRVNSLIQQVVSTNQTSLNEGKSHFVTIGYNPVNYGIMNNEDVYTYLGVKNNKFMWLAAGKSAVMDDAGNMTDGECVKGNDTPLKYDLGSMGKTGGGRDIASPSLSVRTGKYYRVRIVTYIKGLAKFIIVQNL